MASPTYEGNGGLAVSQAGSIDISYPTLSENDILVIQVLSDDNDVHSAISGFTKVTQLAQSSNCSASWYWRRASGSETGTVNCTKTNSDGLMVGVMSTWRGCVTSGTPYEQEQETSGSGINTVTSSSITPQEDDNRIVCLICVEDNTYTGVLAGGNYASNYELPDTTGSDTELAAESFAQATAANEPARLGTVGNDNWVTFTFALNSPPAAATYTIAPNLDVILKSLDRLRSSELDSILRIARSKTLDVNAFFKFVKTRSLETDAILKVLGQLKSSELDSILKQARTQPLDVNAYLKAIKTKALESDAVLKALGQLKTTELSAIHKLLKDKNVDVDGLLKAVQTKAFSVDAIIASLGYLKAVELDAILKILHSRNVLVDTILKVVRQQTLSADAKLSKALSQLNYVELDAIFRLAKAKDVDLDTILKLAKTGDVDLDAILSRVSTQLSSIELNAVLQLLKTEGIDLTAILKLAKLKATDLDAILRLESGTEELNLVLLSLLRRQEKRHITFGTRPNHTFTSSGF